MDMDVQEADMEDDSDMEDEPMHQPPRVASGKRRVVLSEEEEEEEQQLAQAGAESRECMVAFHHATSHAFHAGCLCAVQNPRMMRMRSCSLWRERVGGVRREGAC